MRFDDLVIAGLAEVEAPEVVPSTRFNERLAPTLDRLGIPAAVLWELAGIRERRWWPVGTAPSDAATWAGEKVLREAGVDRSRIGLIVNTSVCRDYVEPSTASLVHQKLGLPATCLNFDLGNACLAFLNGVELAGAMLVRDAIEYALVVAGEGSRAIQEATLDRLAGPGIDKATLERQFASLTLGSGAVAMLLTRAARCPGAPRFTGLVMRAATRHAGLCRGQPTEMETDSRGLLFAGVDLARETFAAARAAFGWRPEDLDEVVLHQVSRVHTRSLCQALGIDPSRALETFPTLGNVGPASVPITLCRARAAGRVRPGARVALMGIGSGLNCAMAELRF